MESELQEKYKKYFEWCQSKGVHCQKIEFPSVFEYNLIGVRAKQDIHHREAFLYVPFNLLITITHVQNHQKLGKVIQENPSLFSEENDDYEQLMLTVFLMYESQLGRDSFWYPYISQLPDVDFFSNWKKSELEQFEDGELIEDAKQYKEDVEKQWLQIQALLKKYPDVFTKEVIKKDIFMKAFAQVCSRCFGWGLPVTSLIPMADNFNHSHVAIFNEAVNLDLQKTAEPPAPYFTKSKFLNNYSELFSFTDLIKYGMRITGMLDKQKYEYKQNLYSLENWKKLIQDCEIWDLPFVEDDVEEDNDTDEEEEQDDEQMDDQERSQETQLKEFQRMKDYFFQGKNDVSTKFEIECQTQSNQEVAKVELNEKNGNAQYTENLDECQDEDFSWYTEEIKDKTYFVFVNCTKRTIKKGEQVFYCYGRRCNAFLLLNYGFAIMDNKFDSFTFRVRLDIKKTDDIKDVNSMIYLFQDWESDFEYYQEIRLKLNILNQTLLAYLRGILQYKFLKENKLKSIDILITRPTSIDYEIYVLETYLELMKYFKQIKEENYTLESDLQQLNDPTISFATRFALVYRAEKKKIIRSNIDLTEFLLNILHKVKKNPNQDIKKLYMEKTTLEKEGAYQKWILNYNEEEQYFNRRLILKEYFRDINELRNKCQK